MKRLRLNTPVIVRSNRREWPGVITSMTTARYGVTIHDGETTRLVYFIPGNLHPVTPEDAERYKAEFEKLQANPAKSSP